MELIPLGIEGAWLAESPVWSDDRGFFREWFKSERIKQVTGRDFNVVQANISSSTKGTVRGIHYSLVIVDISPNSKTFGRWIAVELSGTSGNAVLIGEGLGHGFVSLADVSTVAYLASSPFSPTEEFEINPLDPALGIDWGISLSELRISEKDQNAPTLADRLAEGRLSQKYRQSDSD
jgi:dTDP-4-dehydrorhamnose 3,5-epimerase